MISSLTAEHELGEVSDKDNLPTSLSLFAVHAPSVHCFRGLHTALLASGVSSTQAAVIDEPDLGFETDLIVYDEAAMVVGNGGISV